MFYPGQKLDSWPGFVNGCVSVFNRPSEANLLTYLNSFLSGNSKIIDLLFTWSTDRLSGVNWARVYSGEVPLEEAITKLHYVVFSPEEEWE